jgi:tetratricopeptide (TPR) repeat protein
VDQDPRKYIAANPNPQEAQDYFLLGRAYLLSGEYFQAKNAFNTAKSRINEIDEKDRQTIANEINMALAIIANGPATEKFSQSVSNSSSNSSLTNSLR